MKDTLKLGEIITEKQHRDAVHIAVAPVVAGEKLNPGDHVGINADGLADKAVLRIGVVDPFLKRVVMGGEKFWLFLYPGTITSLRHEWTHPAFVAPDPQAGMGESEKWIRAYCESDADHLSFHDLMQAAEDYELHGEYLIQGGRFEGMWISDEFWLHYAAVKGRAPKQTGSFFSCSC